MPRKEGQFLCEDFYTNAGGLNTADSPFVVSLEEAAGGKNFDYVKRGGVQKRAGHAKLNSVANGEVKSLGFGLWNKPGTAREVVRAAGRKLQNFDFSAYTFTNLTEDTTAAGSDLLGASSTQPVVSSMFVNASASTLWCAGGGATALYGVYSDSKATANGVAALTTSSFTATATGAGGTGTLATGTYRYTLVFRKASTQALGNASTAVEASATFTNGTHDSIDLAWTVSNNDTTKYDKIYIYRSSVGGEAAFTAGALVALVNSNVTTYSDTGTSVSSSENVPRANSTVLDNSVLSSGSPTVLTVFKRRLVSAIGSTIYFSDINKPESWPTYQTITVPSGGDITALGVISMSTGNTSIEEMLVIFKQREVWVVTGDGTLTSTIPDWTLKFINSAGAPNQSVVVSADGYLLWVNYRGVYAWNGAGKPAYISRKIQDKFARGGDIDKSKLKTAWGMYTEGRGEVQWVLSSNSDGEHKYVLKLDLSLSLGSGKAEGVFTPDVLAFPAYAGLSALTATDSTEETIYYGDNAGFVYSGYSGAADGSTSVDFEYITPYLTMGQPNVAKRVTKVVAWVIDNGSYDLELTTWTNYRYKTSEGLVTSVEVNQGITDEGALYGAAVYGTSTYSSFRPRVKPVVFNIKESEGDAIRLKFSQSASNRTLTLYGFSVYYQDIATRK